MSAVPQTREQVSTHIPALHLLCNLGWNFLSTAACLALRGSTREVVLRPRLVPLRAEGAEACRQLVYARSDEIQRFLALVTGSSPGAFKLIRSPGPPDQTRIIEPDGNGSSEFSIDDLQSIDPYKLDH